MDVPTESLNNDNRRKCVRFSVAGSGNKVVLSDGTASVPAVLTDQSAEGFGVRCRQSIPWPVGQTLMLNNSGHWHEVQLKRIRQVDGEELVGMRRIRDCDDYHGPSAFQLLTGIVRRVLQSVFGGNLQIFGICSGFLLCVVVLWIALSPTAPIKQGGRWLGALFADDSSEKPSSAPITPASSATTLPVPESPAPVAAPDALAKLRQASDERAKTMLSGKMVITWADVEDVLGLTEKQSEQLLSLLNGGAAGKLPIGQIDTTKIVIESRENFATFINTLPEKALTFLTEQQLQYLQSLLEQINQS